MRNKLIVAIGLLSFLVAMSPIALIAAPIYYDLDFEDGGFGGGYEFSTGQEATNISSVNLDGNSLLFEVGDQMVWDRNDVDSTTHYVALTIGRRKKLI